MKSFWRVSRSKRRKKDSDKNETEKPAKRTDCCLQQEPERELLEFIWLQLLKNQTGGGKLPVYLALQATCQRTRFCGMVMVYSDICETDVVATAVVQIIIIIIN
jgi:hypothetical protein